MKSFNKRSFTLIEMFLVISILVTLVAIAVPNLMKSKGAANETSCVATMRVIHAAQIKCKSDVGEFRRHVFLYQLGYLRDDLSPNDPTANPALGDGILKNAYLITVEVLRGSNGTVYGYEGFCFPQIPGSKFLYFNHTGKVYFTPDDQYVGVVKDSETGEPTNLTPYGRQ
jgi:type II secretory pathway pseudopilin PulG